jgi:hypothetical protein
VQRASRAPPVYADKSNAGFQSVQVVNEDSGYYATISVDDPQRAAGRGGRAGADEDAVDEYLTGAPGVRFAQPKRDRKHPESYIMFFVWVFLYGLILGTCAVVLPTVRPSA